MARLTEERQDQSTATRVEPTVAVEGRKAGERRSRILVGEGEGGGGGSLTSRQGHSQGTELSYVGAQDGGEEAGRGDHHQTRKMWEGEQGSNLSTHRGKMVH